MSRQPSAGAGGQLLRAVPAGPAQGQAELRFRCRAKEPCPQRRCRRQQRSRPGLPLGSLSGSWAGRVGPRRHWAAVISSPGQRQGLAGKGGVPGPAPQAPPTGQPARHRPWDRPRSSGGRVPRPWHQAPPTGAGRRAPPASVRGSARARVPAPGTPGKVTRGGGARGGEPFPVPPARRFRPEGAGQLRGGAGGAEGKSRLYLAGCAVDAAAAPWTRPRRGGR